MNPIRAHVLLLVLLVLLIPWSLHAAAGTKLTVDGYEFDVAANKLSAGISIRGTVTGGAPCQKLKATLHFLDEQGRSLKVSIVLTDYLNSQRFSMLKEVEKKGNRWLLSEVSVKCNSLVSD